MKILHILGCLPPERCGVGDSMVFISRFQSMAGHDVGILTSNKSNPVGCGVMTINCMPNWSVRNIFLFLSNLKSFKPDVVHIQYPSLGYERYLLPYFVPLICFFLKVPVVQTWHEPPLSNPFGLTKIQTIKRKIYGLRYLPCLISFGPIVWVQEISEPLNFFIRTFLNKKRIFLIPVTSNIPKSSLTTEERNLLRARILLQFNKKNLITFFGYPFPSKGVRKIFEIIDHTTDHILLIFEKKYDQYDVGLKSYLASMENSKSWSISGFLPADKVADFLASSDIVVLPFEQGVQKKNGSFMAARLQGVKILTTSCSCDEGYLIDEKTYYAQKDSIESLQKGLIYLKSVEQTSNQLTSLKINWQDISHMHIELYKTFLKL